MCSIIPRYAGTKVVKNRVATNEMTKMRVVIDREDEERKRRPQVGDVDTFRSIREEAEARSLSLRKRCILQLSPLNRSSSLSSCFSEISSTPLRSMSRAETRCRAACHDSRREGELVV